MAVAVTLSKAVRLEYEKGSMSFNRIERNASNAQLYNLGQIINSLQADTAKKIFVVQRTQII